MPNTPTIPNYPPQGIQAQLDLLYIYNPDVANALVEKLEAGLIEIKELQKEIEKALQDLQGVLRYKGSVQTEEDLPTEGNVIGDVWNIISTDENVAWTGTEWDKFGSAIDLSGYLTKTDAASTYIPLTSINTNKTIQIGDDKVPSSSAFRAFVYEPLYWSQSNFNPKANQAIFINGIYGGSRLVDAVINIYGQNKGLDTQSYVACIRIVSNSYSGRGTAYKAELLFNTLGEDFLLYKDNSGTLFLTTTSGTWAQSAYTLSILQLKASTRVNNLTGAFVGNFTPASYTQLAIDKGATETWAKANFINADASTYTLATLQDAFNYSPARLYKIFNEAKMPTLNTYTLFSLGWTYNDSNNIPTLLASDLQTSKFYFYHGTYENCSPTTWQEFTFGGDALAQEIETNKNDIADLGDQVAAIEEKIPEDASTTNQLATKADIPEDYATSTDLNDVESRVTDIEEKIPENASAINQLVTQADIPSDYLPLSGGTLTGAIKFETNGNITSASNQLWLGAGSGSQVKISTAAMFPGTTSINLGSSFAKWNTIYVQKLNNGATITVPNKVGTLALTADLEDYATSIDLNDVESRVTDIEDKIPEMASSDNKLVTEEDLTAASTSIIIRRW